MEVEQNKTTSNVFRYITLIICVCIVFGLYYVIQVREKYQEQVQISLKLLADNLASDHEGSMYGIRQFLITSGYLVEQQKVDSDTCRTILQRMYVVYPYFLNVGITDQDGNVVCSGVEPGRQINIGNDDDFIHAKNQNKFTVSGYKIGSITGRPSVRFLQPILVDGVFTGVLFVSFATEWLNGFSPSFDPPQSTVITKFDRDGKVFYRYPNPLTWSGTDQANSSLFQVIQEKKIGYHKAVGLEGNNRLYYFRPIYLEGEIHSYIAVGINKGN